MIKISYEVPCQAYYAGSHNILNANPKKSLITISLADSTIMICSIKSAPNEERLIWRTLWIFKKQGITPELVMLNDIAANGIAAKTI